MKNKFGVLVAIVALLVMVASPARAAEVRISAAASMADALKEIAAAFVKERPEVTIRTNFGGSGALAKQIVSGAPADLFISADPKWLDFLIKEGKVAAPWVRTVAFNTLVVVGPGKSAISSLSGLTHFDRIAIGSPKSVPAGQYAEQAMRAAGVYDALQEDNKLVMAQDVRQALLYADRGEVAAAFVYRTDALLAKRAVILYQVPAPLHDRIAYPLALTRIGEKKPEAKALYDYLASPAAVAVLIKYGFETSPVAHPATGRSL